MTSKTQTIHQKNSPLRYFLCLLLLLPGVTNALSGGEFELVDHNGSEYHLEQDRGKLVLMFFGYTSCPDVCPQTMLHVASTLKQLEADADQLQNLFITVDPERDTVSRLQDYVPWFSDQVLGLTGTTAQIKNVAALYNARYTVHKKSIDDTEYVVDHSADLYLIGRDGTLEAVIPFGLPVEHTVKVIRRKMNSDDNNAALISPATEAINTNSSSPQLLKNDIQLEDYRGKPLLLNFWASWCEPCRAEIPSLNRSHKQHANLSLNMVAVNVGESEQAVVKFLHDYPIEFEVALDQNGDSFNQWQLKGLPVTLLFDKNGSEVMRVTGERDWSSTAMINSVRTALGVD